MVVSPQLERLAIDCLDRSVCCVAPIGNQAFQLERQISHMILTLLSFRGNHCGQEEESLKNYALQIAESPSHMPPN
jgi:hypothetical protein